MFVHAFGAGIENKLPSDSSILQSSGSEPGLMRNLRGKAEAYSVVFMMLILELKQFSFANALLPLSHKARGDSGMLRLSLSVAVFSAETKVKAEKRGREKKENKRLGYGDVREASKRQEEEKYCGLWRYTYFLLIILASFSRKMILILTRSRNRFLVCVRARDLPNLERFHRVGRCCR